LGGAAVIYLQGGPNNRVVARSSLTGTQSRAIPVSWRRRNSRHRSITSTGVYTALAPNRFKDLWRD
jgi:hypothetical protein